MKRLVSLILLGVMLINVLGVNVFASDMDESVNSDENIGAEIEDVDVESLNINAKSAMLMEANTGKILYSMNANEALAPASVTKIMTLLLVAEAIANGSISPDDKITVSANATSLGGSQIFLKEGEVFTVEELLKSAVIASANDAAVALAEHIAGTEAHFVSLMNKRAGELGMRDTVFENATGLDDTTENHVTSAYDIALMSRELIKHELVMKYSCIWQDSIRDGEFTLTNTNRLVRYYSGCTGLKTGSTDKAGFCVSATAQRDGMHLIAVIMGAETRDERNNAARTLLDYGFASYAIFNDGEESVGRIRVRRGTLDEVSVYKIGFSCLVSKTDLSNVEIECIIPEYIDGAHASGEVIGAVIYSVEGTEIGRTDIILLDDIGELSLFRLYMRILVGALT